METANIEIGAVVLALTEIAKRMGLPSQALPIFAVLVGAVTGYLKGYLAGEPFGAKTIIEGAIMGLITTGLYGTTSSLAEKTRSI